MLKLPDHGSRRGLSAAAPLGSSRSPSAFAVGTLRKKKVLGFVHFCAGSSCDSMAVAVVLGDGQLTVKDSEGEVLIALDYADIAMLRRCKETEVPRAVPSAAPRVQCRECCAPECCAPSAAP